MTSAPVRGPGAAGIRPDDRRSGTGRPGRRRQRGIGGPAHRRRRGRGSGRPGRYHVDDRELSRFSNGISGSELATRAVVQARRFGAELLLARPLVDVSADGPGYVAELSDGTLIRGRAVLFASGVEWCRLDVPGIDDLLGAGLYYGAGPSEALACTGSRVVVVGGGNSAGQAVVRFSRYARQVTLLVRGRDLGASMSQYLIDHLSAIPHVEARVRTQVVGLEADDRLRAAIVRAGDRTDGATGIALATNPAGYLVTGSDGASNPGGRWPLPREPLPLETNRPGVFAAGDVRCGSVKRCAAAIGEGSMAVALVHRGWRRRAVTEPPAVANPDTAASPQLAELASDEQIATAATASGPCWPPQVPTRGAWSVPSSPAAPRYTTTPPRHSKPPASPTTSNDPAATSRSGCGCTGWTG